LGYDDHDLCLKHHSITKANLLIYWYVQYRYEMCEYFVFDIKCQLVISSTSVQSASVYKYESLIAILYQILNSVFIVFTLFCFERQRVNEAECLMSYCCSWFLQCVCVLKKLEDFYR